MSTLANDRAAGRATGKKVAKILLRDLGLDPDDPSLEDRALEARANINGNERFPYEHDEDRAEDLYHAWDAGFWETFDVACAALRPAVGLEEAWRRAQ